MKFLFVLAIVTSPFFIQNAVAAPAFACATAESVDNNGEGNCEENNEKFAKAGQDCLKTLEAAIQARASVANVQMAASNLAKTVTSGNGQTNNFSGANADYGISQQALADLIEAAKKARRAVEGQLSHIYYPEDFDAPEEVIGDPMDFLNEVSCYSDNEKSLKKTIKTIDQHIADLEKAKLASAQRGNISNTRDQSLQNSVSKGPALKGGSAQGSGAIKAGTTGNRESDVSGVEESKKKNEQKK